MMTRARCVLYELSLWPRGLLLLFLWALQCPWQVRCSHPPTIARHGCTGSPYVYYRNLGSLRYGNDYCVPCRAMVMYDSVVASVDVNLRILWQSGRLNSQTPHPFWRDLVSIAEHTSIGSFNTAAEPLVRFYSTAQTNFPICVLK